MVDTSENLVLDGLTVAPNVIVTIVRLATKKVEGVVGIYAPAFRKSVGSHGIEMHADADGRLVVGVHVQTRYGVKLHELGAAIQSAVSDALEIQVGVAPAAVDVFIDALVFED